MKQKEAALKAMKEWLLEDGVVQEESLFMDLAFTFDLHQMQYYVIRFKEHQEDEWMLGVCGGYEKEEKEHCGHVFSRYLPFVEETAKQDAIDIVEFIRTYWMERADAAIKRNNNVEEQEVEPTNGNFHGFALFDCHEVVIKDACKLFQKQWGIKATVAESEACSEDSIVLEIEDMLVAISFIDAIIPDQEAQYYGKNNYFWSNAEEAIDRHVSQVLIAVLGHEQSCLDAAKLFVKIASSVLMLPGAIGLYTSGTVFQASFYKESAESMKEGVIPVNNLIYIGLYPSAHGYSGYTVGLKAFHKEEIEIVDARTDAMMLREFLMDIVYYLLEENVTLRDGETIGFSEDQKLPITYSKGVALEGNTLKIHM